MNKMLLVGFIMLFVLALGSAAQADSFTFFFDNRVDDPFPLTLTPVTPVGTFTVSDDANPNWVDLHVVLLPGHDAISEFLFNFNGFPITGKHFVLDDGRVTGKGTVTASLNGEDIVGYNNHFDVDVVVPDGAAAPKVKTYDAILKLQLVASPHTDSNLDASMFNLTDDNGLFAWIKPVSCGPPDCPSVEIDSYQYVAKTEVFVPTTTAVPEPATMLLFGSGLLSLAVLRRMFKK